MHNAPHTYAIIIIRLFERREAFPASSVQSTDYIKPELLAVALVLYFVGIGLKHSQTIPCEKEE